MYIYGKNVIKEALKTKKMMQTIYLYKDFGDRDLKQMLEQNQFKIKYVEKRALDELVDGNHQGIVAVVDDYEYATLEEVTEKENAFVVILDHLEDPHNFGAIIRTCEAAGVTGIIIPKNRSVSVNSTVVRVSVGALEHMKIVSVTNLKNTIEDMKKNGFWIVGTDMEGTPYEKIDYHGKIAIVIGNEGTGMSRLVRESCDFIASIPMSGTINSLNASVATGIVVFEALKNRR